MSRHRLSVLARGALALSIVLAGCRFSGFGDTPSRAKATTAASWLTGQQQADGGFEVGGFAGFETPDAVLALAENAQTKYFWNSDQARNAVKSVVRNGRTPLHALDDFADTAINAGQAAKLIVLDVVPLGLDPRHFNPDGDVSRDLVAVVDFSARGDGSYGTLNASLFAAIAKRLVSGAVPAKTLTFIRNAQQANGGWSFSGNPAGTDLDIDTTGLAVQALVAAQVAPNDGSLTRALAFLAGQHQASGAWRSFGSDDPNSTSLAVLAITAAGFNPSVKCWRDTVAPGLASSAYTSPTLWLGTQQASDGHIKSPNDAFPPVNTFATSQTIQALRRGWIPVTPLSPSRSC
jgi:hypothetical protein